MVSCGGGVVELIPRCRVAWKIVDDELRAVHGIVCWMMRDAQGPPFVSSMGPSRVLDGGSVVDRSLRCGHRAGTPDAQDSDVPSRTVKSVSEQEEDQLAMSSAFHADDHVARPRAWGGAHDLLLLPAAMLEPPQVSWG